MDDVLGEVPGLQAAADVVKVANPAPGRLGRQDEDGPVVKSNATTRAVASGNWTILNSDREMARRDLDPRARCRLCSISSTRT